MRSQTRRGPKAGQVEGTPAVDARPIRLGNVLWDELDDVVRSEMPGLRRCRVV